MTRPFTGRHMAIIIISFFAVIIAVNLTMAYFARSSWTGLVVKNSYVASQSFNRDAEIARQQQALGWQMTLKVKREAVQFTVLDRDNQAMAGLRIRAVLQRPTDEAGDQHLKLRESGAGIYRTDAVIGGGVWVADITAEKSDTELVRFVQRIFVK
ncbi:MAG TPA: FixH family protein [Aestuariivirga sp.]|nr:FixH family protein [Aestuariivirga sp.]